MDAVDFKDVLESVRRFVRTEVVPLEEQIDRTDEMPEHIRAMARDMGLFGFAIPAEFGGLGLTVVEQVQLIMELGWTTPALRSMVGTNNAIAGSVLLVGGTPSQQETWLPRLASGEVVAAFGLTEPDAGSDPSTLTTAASRDGDEWVLNGNKRFITNAPLADVIMVFARTLPDAAPSRGIGNFIVPADAAGVSLGPRDVKMGQAGAWSCDVYLDDVRVPADHLVGGDDGVGTGYLTALKCLAHGRLHIAALSVGMAQRLVDETVRYAQERHQGGQPIAAYQLVQGMVADSITETRAGRALLLDAAAAYDRGDDLRTGPSVAKYFCSEMVGRVADRAVQVHGGAGYIRGTPAERFYRDARLFRLYEGTSQIQQVIIATAALGDAARATGKD